MFIQYYLTLKGAIRFNCLLQAKGKFSYAKYQPLIFQNSFYFSYSEGVRDTASKDLIIVMVFLENILGSFYLSIKTLCMRSITCLLQDVEYGANVKEQISKR